jgi:hypothetical protein
MILLFDLSEHQDHRRFDAENRFIVPAALIKAISCGKISFFSKYMWLPGEVFPLLRCCGALNSISLQLNFL